ncbi:ICOS ligand [Labeo rohita]|uniref:ICOS ligand n=1 Tax=Labeo rohita TaxID=84645 RepID=A0ABQ8L0V4_LABRO|nr:ICOS ligand [Labeo rohita]
MEKTADLTVIQKTTTDTLHKEGKTQKVIAKEAGCSQSFVSKHINREVKGRKRCGRKKCSSSRDNRTLERIVKQNPFKNVGEIHKEWTAAGQELDAIDQGCSTLLLLLEVLTCRAETNHIRSVMSVQCWKAFPILTRVQYSSDRNPSLSSDIPLTIFSIVTVEGVIGGSVVLPCSSTEHDFKLQEVDVSWRHNGSKRVCDLTPHSNLLETHDQRYKNRTVTFPEEYDRRNFSIKLTGLTYADAGKYICLITPSDEQETVLLIINGEHSVGSDALEDVSCDQHYKLVTADDEMNTELTHVQLYIRTVSA